MQTIAIQPGGEARYSGVVEFVPAFVPFQGRDRFAYALRKRHVHRQIELIGLDCRSIFRRERFDPLSLTRFNRPNLYA